MSTNLPPLPEPELTCWYGPSSEFHEEHMFSADQMREYAAAAMASVPCAAVPDATEVVRMLTQVIPFRLGLIEQSVNRDDAKHQCEVIRECLERTLEALKPIGTIAGTATP